MTDASKMPVSSIARIRRRIGQWLTCPPPAMVCIETITTCNRRCTYCPNSLFDRGLPQNQQVMAVNLFRQIIDDLASAGWRGEIVPHLYGEPLLDTRLPELVSYVRANLVHSTISLFSNGDYLTMGRYRELVNCGINRFVITQHSVVPHAEVAAILNDRQRQGRQEVEFVYSRLGTLRNRGGLLAGAGHRPAACSVPAHTMYIMVSGDAVFCCDDYLATSVMGNVFEGNVLSVWERRGYRRLRHETAHGIFRLPICRNCRELLQSP